MSYNFLVFVVKDGVGMIRLNRPDDGNVITLEMAGELLDVAGRCDEDPDVRAVVLTGAGKMFCAGGDLKSFAAQGAGVSLYLKQVTQPFHAAISRLNWMDAPVIGAINGTAAGGGLSLALATDIAIAAESAKIHHGLYQGGPGPGRRLHLFFSAPGGAAPGQGNGVAQPGVVGPASPGMGTRQPGGGR